MYEDIWEKLYCEARKVQKERVISPFIEAGGYGKYTGNVC